MGQTCTCIKSCTNEIHQVITENDSEYHLEHKKNECLENYTSSGMIANTEDIIMLQSLLRGYSDRKSARKIYQARYFSNDHNLSLSFHEKELTEAQELISKYSNAVVIMAEEKIGAFFYKKEINDGVLTTLKPHVLLENKAVYIGN